MFNLRRQRTDNAILDQEDSEEAQVGMNPAVQNPTCPPGVAFEQYAGGLTVNPHTVGHYSNDVDHTPILVTRIATRWGDIQLKNGLANGVASGRINSYRGEGWYDNVVPYVPGQTRLIGGGHPGYFPARGMAPSQWQNHVNAGPGSQPDYPGGPGQMMGGGLFNPGSGG